MQREDGWQVGVRVRQRNFDGVFVDRLETGHLSCDLGDLGTDSGIEVTLQRIDHVIGRQRLAVMEGDAGTQFDRPRFGILRFDGFGELHLWCAGNVEKGKPVIKGAATDIICRKRGLCGSSVSAVEEDHPAAFNEPPETGVAATAFEARPRMVDPAESATPPASIM